MNAERIFAFLTAVNLDAFAVSVVLDKPNPGGFLIAAVVLFVFFLLSVASESE